MFTTTYKDDPRQDHVEQRKLIKDSPLETLDYILENNIDIDTLQAPAHMSTQYRWHQNLKPHLTVYKSFAEYKKRSQQIVKYKSERVEPHLEPHLKEITEKVKTIYRKDYIYFSIIPYASKCLEEWL